jgi:hypothetical protein
LLAARTQGGASRSAGGTAVRVASVKLERTVPAKKSYGRIIDVPEPETR